MRRSELVQRASGGWQRRDSAAQRSGDGWRWQGQQCNAAASAQCTVGDMQTDGHSSQMAAAASSDSNELKRKKRKKQKTDRFPNRMAPSYLPSCESSIIPIDTIRSLS